MNPPFVEGYNLYIDIKVLVFRAEESYLKMVG